VHAQFNAAYGLARALTDGKVDLRSYVKPAITDPAVAALAARIKVLSDPAIEATAIEPARVIVRLKDGRILERGSDTIKGSPQEPLGEAELAEKFHACMAFGLGASRADTAGLLEIVRNLERTNDAGRDIVAAFPHARDS
jgi:2-methylcitrate dehydratase PrpD